MSCGVCGGEEENAAKRVPIQHDKGAHSTSDRLRHASCIKRRKTGQSTNEEGENALVLGNVDHKLELGELLQNIGWFHFLDASPSHWCDFRLVRDDATLHTPLLHLLEVATTTRARHQVSDRRAMSGWSRKRVLERERCNCGKWLVFLTC
jgi:hypothetical protein